MRRRDPPPGAAWMLEHMTSGNRDEALAGDLLEAIQSGRSDGWYWRQTLAACAVSWFESLRVRAPMLVFALLWSMMAPAWNTVCIIAEDHSPHLSRLQGIVGPFWIIPALLGWTILHSIFLWGGLLIFSVFQSRVGVSLHPGRFKRAFLLAPVIFVPAYGALFATVALYWYSLFGHFQLWASPLDQIGDLRLLADAIRIPYLLALVCALWGAIPRSRSNPYAALHDPGALNSTGESEVLSLTSAKDSFVARHFFELMVGAGLTNSIIAGLLLCQLPDSHSPTLASLATRATLYVLAGLLAGAGGTYLYWKNPASPFRDAEPLPFLLFALTCAGGWVWVPAMVILLEQLSPASVPVAVIASFVFASGLRRVSSSVHGPIPCLVAASEHGDADLFVESLYPAPVETYGYMIALSLYAGAAAFFLHSYFTAAALFVLAASVFAWKRAIPQSQCSDGGQEYRRASLRLAGLVVPALLITVWALLDGVAHRNLLSEAGEGSALHAGNSAGKKAAKKSISQTTALGMGGYESVILWPYHKKELAVPPIGAEDTLLAPGTKQPLVIHFNGPYWYFQPPNKRPGLTAHKATGTPLAVDIQSNNFVPIVMDAHQYLPAAIPIARCREIAIDIENRDNTAGEISLGVLLSNGGATKPATVYLGEQPIVSTQPGRFSLKTAPVFETLHFSLPAGATMRKFSEITVLVLPDVEHEFEAPKIAVEQSRLYPR